MLRYIILVTAVFVTLIPRAVADISEQTAKKAIRTLLDKPLSSAAQTAGVTILKFADSSNYRVVISKGYLPWAGSSDLPVGSQMLMAAFVAGNLQAQINKNSTQPEPYAGVLAAIQVYTKLATKSPSFKIPLAEKFIAMQQQGTLRRHIEAIKP